MRGRAGGEGRVGTGNISTIRTQIGQIILRSFGYRREHKTRHINVLISLFSAQNVLSNRQFKMIC